MALPWDKQRITDKLTQLKQRGSVNDVDILSAIIEELNQRELEEFIAFSLHGVLYTLKKLSLASDQMRPTDALFIVTLMTLEHVFTQPIMWDFDIIKGRLLNSLEAMSTHLNAQKTQEEATNE